MGFQFEKFVEVDKTFSARVTVRQKTGQIGFNLGSVNRYDIRNYRYAVLYFDRSHRAVGIELTNACADGAIELKQSQTNTYVRAKNFLDKYGIDYEKSHSYDLKQDPETGLLFFELSDVVEEDEEEPEPANEYADENLADAAARFPLPNAEIPF